MNQAAYTDDQAAQITQLQQQQALMTQAIAAMLEGRWAGGASTVEAFLFALNPQFQGQLANDLPVTQSEYEADSPGKA